MVSQDAFLQSYAALHASLEQRRQRYLRMFYVNLLLAVLLLATVTWAPVESLRWIAVLLHHEHALHGYEIVSWVIFAYVAAFGLILAPIVNYQGGFKAEYSLSRLIMLRLCEMFEGCRLSSPATLLDHVARESALFPAGAGISELVGVRRESDGFVCLLQEMAVSSQEDDKNYCFFKGLFIYCKASMPYHENFRVIVHHQEFLNSDNLARFGEKMESLALPSLYLKLAAYSERQGQNWLSTEWLGLIESLETRAAQLPPSRVMLDSLMLSTLRNIALSIKEYFVARYEKPALAAELDYDAQFAPLPDMMTAVQSQGSPFEGNYAVSLQENQLILALPSATSLFGQSSLFDDPIDKAKAQFFYQLISDTETMCRSFFNRDENSNLRP